MLFEMTKNKFIFQVSFILFSFLCKRTLNQSTNNIPAVQDKAQVLKAAIETYKTQLHLTQHQISLLEHLAQNKSYESVPKIYVVTPTYWRYLQKAELTRIAQTLKLVPNVHWILVEDSKNKTDLVKNLVAESGLSVTHLSVPSPTSEQRKKLGQKWELKGLWQRNAALKWLRDNFRPNQQKGIVYFMDDDNTYSVKLFEEMSKIKKVGVWPVGLVALQTADAPIVNKTTGKVSAWSSGFNPNRAFAIDMAGFAINLDIILGTPNATFDKNAVPGMQESNFLSLFTTKEEIEPLADNCTKVYVWHTRTEKPTVNQIVPGLEV